MITESDIQHIVDSAKKRKIEIPPVTLGIYFLFSGDEVVYVGQSQDVMSRIMTHRGNGIIRFDSASAVPTNNSHKNEVEATLIVMMNPKYNKEIPYNRIWVSIEGLKRATKHTLPQLKKYMREKGINPVNNYYRISEFSEIARYDHKS